MFVTCILQSHNQLPLRSKLTTEKPALFLVAQYFFGRFSKKGKKKVVSKTKLKEGGWGRVGGSQPPTSLYCPFIPGVFSCQGPFRDRDHLGTLPTFFIFLAKLNSYYGKCFCLELLPMIFVGR